MGRWGRKLADFFAAAVLAFGTVYLFGRWTSRRPVSTASDEEQAMTSMRGKGTTNPRAAGLGSEIQITDLASLERAIVEVNARFSSEVAFWRGHEVESWPLQAGVFRPQGNPGGMPRRYNESALLWHFVHRAPTRFQNCPATDDSIGWLFVAQHYGLPTRLLDWTESALVGLYFAVANPDHDNVDGCLWALRATRLNRRMVDQEALVVLDEPVVHRMVDQAFGVRETGRVPPVIAIPAREIDARMLVQESVFTLHSTPQNMADISEVEPCLHKFVVPANAKRAVREHLSWAAIRRWNLFPDLPTLAAELKRGQFTS